MIKSHHTVNIPIPSARFRNLNQDVLFRKANNQSAPACLLINHESVIFFFNIRTQMKANFLNSVSVKPKYLLKAQLRKHQFICFVWIENKFAGVSECLFSGGFLSQICRCFGLGSIIMIFVHRLSYRNNRIFNASKLGP